MKILQLCTKVPYPLLDGGSIAIYSLSRGLVQAGHTVDILAMNTPKHYQNPKDKIIIPALRIIPIDVDTRIRITKALQNLLFSKLPYNAERFISPHFNESLIRLLKDHQYDIVQLEGLYVAHYMNTIKENSEALIVFRAHNIEHEIWERSITASSGLKKAYLKVLTRRLKRFEQSIINRYDLLVPITERDRGYFLKMGNNKPIWVSPTGVDFKNMPQEAHKETSPSLFFLGALDWLPNQEGLVWFLKKVWIKIHKRFPCLPLYIAGRNAPGWLIHKFHLPNITYLGEIQDAYTFMLSHGIMIVPLFSGSGLRIKIIEGMALGKVILATTIAVEGVAVRNNENIRIADTEEQFITTLDQLINDQQLCHKISINAQEFARKNYDNLTISFSLAEFYKSFLK